ncbi:Putative receptor protein kinase ZmPK1 [Morus notabilis]|uniref:Receptor-like serine/threonine-protein kinase n=1 Tax=Morus notabilis TaxID=981085 RepID=W9RLY4_9ROSA|nr:putative receptor protein kinase ZmPK1 [Morus notabilis]EXB85454.1 Putative receptor protein kinase ZmPK1 [Morus notabilis]
MATLFVSYVFFVAITSSLSSSNAHLTLTAGSSLSVERPNDVLTSPNGIFSAGFHLVEENAYYFAIWFNEPSSDKDRTIVWMANRDQPVNRKRSKLSLLKNGNLILTDVGQITIWSTGTVSRSSSQLHLDDTGNMVLRTSDGVVLWQSFDSPTDTLLPEQPLTRSGKLVSSRSQTNLSSSFYKLFFDNDNVLRLIYDSIQFSSVYWPAPWLLSWESGRSTYNNSKTAVLDSLGNFSSSDDFTFMSADYGANIQRMLRIDYDGNVRLYSRKNLGEKWVVMWQAFSDTCKIHGLCGANSLCSYSPNSGRKCSCLQGYKMRNQSDWFYGCEPEFTLTCGKNDSTFIKISNSEFFGYDFGFYPNSTFDACMDLCSQVCHCVGFQYSLYQSRDLLNFNCYPKTLLLNGYQTPSFFGDIYLKVPNTSQFSSRNSIEEFMLDCSNNITTDLPRTYRKSHVNMLVKLMLWFACGVGAFEVICIFCVWCLIIRNRQGSREDTQDYVLHTAGFKRFSFNELKKATRGFSEEIGRGAGGIVYKGVLSDSRVVAIKRLREALQGEAEFLAEVSTIGRVHHMNLIEMWGYCAEGKHRLLVYEYLEHGSLKENLSKNVLDWKMRYEISLGTARGLAYLHNDCLEWVLHCDVKPQNILLGSEYQPKVADFGFSKLLNRGELRNPSFSRIRGTRGYMAPEWVTNQSITSKVDVYSYGIVLLEMLSGRSTSAHDADGVHQETHTRGLVKWVRDKVSGNNNDMTLCMEEVVESWMKGEYAKEKMRILLEVALKCVEEDKDARPTMSEVVEMLQGP